MSEISSQHAIHRYSGRQALDLMDAPLEFVSEWQRLIDNVLSIHSTEISDGSIPIFFTALHPEDPSVRIPNPDSTLTELKPGSSYYFIMRSQANLPVVLPEVGGTIVGCDINECTPIRIQELNDVNLVGKDNNKQFITVCASGLTCGETYNFHFSSPVSNWPTYVNPISGTFVAAKDKVEIPAEITFSKETGNLDPENLLDYKIYKDVNYHACHSEDFNVYSIIKTTIEPVSYQGLHDEDIFKIHCIDCLPDCDPYASVKFVDSPLKKLDIKCCQENTNIVVDVRDARLGELYDYKFISDSLYPLAISPISGTVGFGKYYSQPVNMINPDVNDTAGGQINTLVNLLENMDAVLKIELTHRNTKTVSTDYLTINCSGCI